jgi:hypothetical protein
MSFASALTGPSDPPRQAEKRRRSVTAPAVAPKLRAPFRISYPRRE